MKELQANPLKYLNELSAEKVGDVLKAESPQISAIKKQLGHEGITAILSLMLVDLSRFFKVGKRLEDEQVTQLVSLIMGEYWYFKLEDFKLCFEWAKKGRYGKVYDRVDGNVILEWLNDYSNIRAEEIQAIRLNESMQNKKADKALNPLAIPELRESVKKMLDKGTAAPEKKPEPQKNEITLKAQEWLKEFDRLYRRHKVSDKAVRLINYKGEVMDQNQFLECKLEEYQKEATNED